MFFILVDATLEGSESFGSVGTLVSSRLLSVSPIGVNEAADNQDGEDGSTDDGAFLKCDDKLIFLIY